MMSDSSIYNRRCAPGRAISQPDVSLIAPVHSSTSISSMVSSTDSEWPIFDVLDDARSESSDTSISSCCTPLDLDKTKAIVAQLSPSTPRKTTPLEPLGKLPVKTSPDTVKELYNIIYEVGREEERPMLPRLKCFKADCDTLEELTSLSRKTSVQSSIWNDNGRGWARQWIDLFVRLHWPGQEQTVTYTRETTWEQLEEVSKKRRDEGVDRSKKILACAGVNEELAISLWEMLVRHLTGNNPDDDDEETIRGIPLRRASCNEQQFKCSRPSERERRNSENSIRGLSLGSIKRLAMPMYKPVLRSGKKLFRGSDFRKCT